MLPGVLVSNSTLVTKPIGMTYLHQTKPDPIIHRGCLLSYFSWVLLTWSDLKSHNLLVTGDFAVKVADFGLARVVSRTQTMTLQVGSPAWFDI